MHVAHHHVGMHHRVLPNSRPLVACPAAAPSTSQPSQERRPDERRKLFNRDSEDERGAGSRGEDPSSNGTRRGQRRQPNPMVRGRARLGKGTNAEGAADTAAGGGQGGRQGSWDEEQPGWAVSQATAEQQQQQQSTGRQQRPPRMPVVRPRLDLPVVRPNDDDKGTFYAQGARFDELGLSKDVVDALRSLGIRRPSHVQAAALDAWRSLETQHIAIADQAGSGKTLAYLLPLFQAIRAQDRTSGGPSNQPRCPRAVVITPTTELVQQVYRVAKSLSNAGARIRTLAITGGQTDERDRARSLRTQKERLAEGVDLVIATPGRVVELLKAGHMDLTQCKALVLDEVDVLLGDTAAFESQMAPLREFAPPSLRFMLVTATLPQHTAQALQQSFRSITLATGPGLHRTAAGLVEELVDCSGGDEISLESGTQRKMEAMIKVLQQHKADRALVFCNKIEACRSVENALRRHYDAADVQVLVYHEAIREDLRQAAMNAFLAPVGQEGDALTYLQRTPRPAATSDAAGAQGEVGEESDSAQARPQEQEAVRVPESRDRGGASKDGPSKPPRLIMVATDRMSRGIDCMHCQHVVLFDFPRDPSEYVRRVGRTARGAGGTGVVSALVLGRQVPLARDIMQRNQKGQPVHRLPRL